MDLTADENAPDPGRDVLIGEVVATSLSRSVAAIIERDAGVRLGLDPEDLHQFRVATTR